MLPQGPDKRRKGIVARVDSPHDLTEALQHPPRGVCDAPEAVFCGAIRRLGVELAAGDLGEHGDLGEAGADLVVHVPRDAGALGVEGALGFQLGELATVAPPG